MLDNHLYRLFLHLTFFQKDSCKKTSIKLYKDYIENNRSEETINVCKEYSAIIGKEIYIIKGDERELVKCIDLNKDGNLIIKDNNDSIREIMSGEVSIRGVKGYV